MARRRSLMLKFRQTLPDMQIMRMVNGHNALAFAFANVRPTDELMSLVRKTLAWSQELPPR